MNIIKTIKLEIAGVEIEITPDQAKELQEALNALLGTKEVCHQSHWYPIWPYPTWKQNITWTGTGSGNWPSGIFYDASAQSAIVNVS